MGGKSTFIRQVPSSFWFGHLLTCPSEYVFDELKCHDDFDLSEFIYFSHIF